jgi:hypothetical protein
MIMVDRITEPEPNVEEAVNKLFETWEKISIEETLFRKEYELFKLQKEQLDNERRIIQQEFKLNMEKYLDLLSLDADLKNAFTKNSLWVKRLGALYTQSSGNIDKILDSIKKLLSLIAKTISESRATILFLQNELKLERARREEATDMLSEFLIIEQEKKEELMKKLEEESEDIAEIEKTEEEEEEFDEASLNLLEEE